MVLALWNILHIQLFRVAAPYRDDLNKREEKSDKGHRKFLVFKKTFSLMIRFDIFIFTLGSADITRSVANTTTFHFPNYSLWQFPRHWYCVNAFHKASYSLPLAHPTILRTHNCDHSIKIWTCACVHILPIVSHS